MFILYLVGNTDQSLPINNKGIILPPAVKKQTDEQERRGDSFSKKGENIQLLCDGIIPEPRMRFSDHTLRRELQLQGFNPEQMNEPLGNQDFLQRIKLMQDMLTRLLELRYISDKEAQDFERLYIAMSASAVYPIVALRSLRNLKLTTPAAISALASAISSVMSYAADWVKKEAKEHPEYATELNEVFSGGNSPQCPLTDNCLAEVEEGTINPFLPQIACAVAPHLFNSENSNESVEEDSNNNVTTATRNEEPETVNVNNEVDMDNSDPEAGEQVARNNLGRIDSDNSLVSYDCDLLAEEPIENETEDDMETCEEVCVAEEKLGDIEVQSGEIATTAFVDSNLIHENYKEEKLTQKQRIQDQADYLKTQITALQNQINNATSPEEIKILKANIDQLTPQQIALNGSKLNTVA